MLYFRYADRLTRVFCEIIHCNITHYSLNSDSNLRYWIFLKNKKQPFISFVYLLQYNEEDIFQLVTRLHVDRGLSSGRLSRPQMRVQSVNTVLYLNFVYCFF